MAQGGSSQDLWDELDCSLCLDSFTKPKVLPCGHTFCLDCLSKYSESLANKYRFPCPLCKEVTTVPFQSIEHLPNNYVAQNMIAKIKKPQKNESVLCDICEESSLIASFCKKCENSMCKICTINHKKFKSDHELYNIKALNEECKTKGVERMKELEIWHTNLIAKRDHLKKISDEVLIDWRELEDKIYKHAQEVTEMIEQSKNKLMCRVKQFHVNKDSQLQKSLQTVSLHLAEMESFQTLTASFGASEDVKENTKHLREIEQFMSSRGEALRQTGEIPPNVCLAWEPSCEIMTSFQDDSLGQLREGER